MQYVPIADVDRSLLERTDTATYCPFKGDASYYTVTVDGKQAVDAVWFYESPHPAVAEIKDHVGLLSRPGRLHRRRVAARPPPGAFPRVPRGGLFREHGRTRAAAGAGRRSGR
ncbi:DUF427 domain-containing protein [Streptosporangium vulgare]|uniref:DUF427 domain-containing protein n=1 Tax=Streptosporangium vulgare TaxID=46190 RepID=UPI0031D6948F